MAEYIERDIAKNAIGAIMPSMSTLDGRGEYDHLVLAAQEMCVDAITAIREIPAADVAPVVHGKWVYGEDVDIQCSVCGVDALTEGDYRQVKSRYCPNCGAKMDLKEEL